MSDTEAADYNESVVMVDPNDIEMASDDDDDDPDTSLTIDCDYDDSYDPMSLVSVGLDEEEEEEDVAEETQGGSGQCDICSETFSDRRQLAKHIKTVHPKSCCVACQYCGRVLSDAENYRRHLNNMHKIKLPSSPLPLPTSPLPPTQTIKQSPQTKQTQAQPVFSIPSNVRKCPDCDQQFATKTTLNIHRLKVHVAGLKNLPCPQCNEVHFLRGSNYQNLFYSIL